MLVQMIDNELSVIPFIQSQSDVNWIIILTPIHTHKWNLIFIALIKHMLLFYPV